MPSRRDLSSADVSSAFRALADEHAQKRGSAERSRTWQAIQARMAQREGLETSRFSFRVAVPAAAAVAALAAGVAFALLPSELEYQVRGAEIAAGWIQARTQTASVDFSDGSQVGVHPNSSLAIEVTGKHAARTRLAQGDLDVNVKHARSTDYRFLAGPYEVRVVGTKFHLVWRPEQQLFSVAMQEGRVQVTGPNGLDRAVSAGETLRIGGADSRAAVASLEPAAPRSSLNGVAPGAEVHAVEKPGVTAPHSPRTNSAPALAHADATPAWSALVAKGQFSEVVKSAEALGAERVLRERGSADLSALAHAANYTGHGALAVSAWSALRERFAGQKPARQAAFFLGRVYDQQGRRAEALRWLNTYLSEAPSDVYSSEALGRKLTLVNKLEGTLAARNVAREYMKRFPRGAYAQTARAILED
ncbi:MAG: FecR domain-containing protein [Myxococcota bacterium]